MGQHQYNPCPLCGWEIPDGATHNDIYDHVKECAPWAAGIARMLLDADLARRDAEKARKAQNN